MYTKKKPKEKILHPNPFNNFICLCIVTYLEIYKLLPETFEAKRILFPLLSPFNTSPTPYN